MYSIDTMHPIYDHVKHTNNCAAIQFRLYLSTPKHVFEAIDKYTQSKAQTQARIHSIAQTQLKTDAVIHTT